MNASRITEKEVDEFIRALSYEEKLRILESHSRKNLIRIVKQEEATINSQFEEFLRAKGITAKFKLSFENMDENAHKQQEQNEAEQKDFYEFLRTKGVKPKMKLAFEQMKKNADEVREHNRQMIETMKNEGFYEPPIDIERLSEEFNAFLRMKGIMTSYHIIIDEAED